MNSCPQDRDDIAEAFVMKRLPAAEMLPFYTHLMTCDDCTRAVKNAEDYIAAVRAAAVRLMKEH
jgi:HEPN domain-containing protein